MSMYIYGIYDRKAQYYNHFYLSATEPDAEAANFIRSLKYARKAGLTDDCTSLIVLYSEDFELHLIGSLDENTGSIFDDERVIAFGTDAVEIVENEGI